ncbi:MAG: murein biosynthesis integral membrane protein MurJ [Desulforhopalus sp.]|nr:murein biosynthesis integral membrane protein MurJ [Desulforhopalus sp.]
MPETNSAPPDKAKIREKAPDNKKENNNKEIARSAGSVGIAVMCSRVLGLVREQIFAGFFGAGFTYDAFVVAFRIPNLLRDLFGEGALSAAFVTVFSRYDAKKSETETFQLASNVLTFFLIVLSLLVLVAIYYAGTIVSLLAPNFAGIPGKVELTEKLTRIMLPFMVFISLSAVVMGMLNTKGKFFVPALASSFFNLGSIISGTGLALLLPFFGQSAIVGMAFGTLIGGILQLAVQIPTLRGTGYRYRPQLNLLDSGLHRILKLMLPATIGLSATQINIFINTNFAASCAQGSVSWLYYAFRLVQLPIGIFGVALSIAMLPVLAKQAARKQVEEMKETLVSSLTMVFALTIPATAGLILLAAPIIRLIFEHGAFTPADTLATANTLVFYSIGLFAYSANKVLVPAFYALDKTRWPVIASFLAIGMNITIVTLTIDRWQHLAIALSTSCVMIINCVFLLTILYRSMGGFPLRTLLNGLWKTALSCAGLVAVIELLLPLLGGLLSGGSAGQCLGVSLLVTAGGVTYLLILSTLKLPELDVLTVKIKAKFGR